MITIEELSERLGTIEERAEPGAPLTFVQSEAMAKLFRALLRVVDAGGLEGAVKDAMLAAAAAAALAVPERLRGKSGEYVSEVFLLAEQLIGKAL